MAEEKRQEKNRRKTICYLHREASCTNRSQTSAISKALKNKEKIGRKSRKDRDPRVKLQPAGASGMDLGASWINPRVPAVLSEEEG